MSRIRIAGDLVFLIFFISFIVSSMFAVSYLTTNDVFDAKISYVNDVKLPYSIILDIHNKIDDELEFDVEIIFKKENLVVGSKRFDCFGNCEEKIELNKIFFDDYLVEVVADHDGKRYKKELEFVLNKPVSNLNFDIPSKIYVNSETISNLSLSGYLFLDYDSKVFFQAHLKENPEIRSVLEVDCVSGSCYFEIPFKSDFAFGEYVLSASTFNDVVTRDFKIIYKNVLDSDSSEVEIIKNVSKSLKLDKYYDEIQVIDVLGVTKNISLDSDLIEDVNDYLSVNLGAINERKNLRIKPSISSINEISELRPIEESNTSIKKLNKKGFTTFSTFDVSIIPESNPVVFTDENIYFKNGLSSIGLDDDVSSFKRKLVPGIYKREKITRYQDGSEILFEDYFAYGLISINTKKPLYRKDELVEMLIVVLDRGGFLISDADISLTIVSPLNERYILDSSSLEILESSEKGVYESQIFVEELGKYKLYAEVEIDSMILNVSSYFNVVEDYDFDILRDVPATIDPWLGPFNNTFKIVPLNGYDGSYNFEEVFSSDFKIIETDADNVEIIGDSIYLKWLDLNGLSEPYYIAQVPLVTPYLYYLGESKVFYDDYEFYENRSWLFAIDPAAKTCGITSPCTCGSICSAGDGSSEPGAGTIDSCTDANTNYEYVSNVRVTSLNGSYFGTGDTVKVCTTFVCESNDRTSIIYKDEGQTWASGTFLLDVSSINAAGVCWFEEVEMCFNQVLNNYVGLHQVRGKNVYTEGDGVTCSNDMYRDHDDIEFKVLKKDAAYYTSWNLYNGSSVGDGLDVIRGNNITIFAKWDKLVRDAIVKHNGNSSFSNYTGLYLSSNYSNYTAKTSNLVEFNHVGIVNVSYINSWDLYFNLTNKTSPKKYFEIFGSLKINQSKLEPYIMFNGSSTNVSCQVTDDNVGVTYSNVNVSFYHNITGYLGSDLTNSSGWSNISFVENDIGEYLITCNVSDQLSDYFIASNNNYANQVLTVKKNNTDIVIPVIVDISSNPSLFSIGGITSISANVTDDINLSSVYVNIKLPNGTSFNYSMYNTLGDIFEYNFSITSSDGNYDYYIYAFDNSSNKAWSSTKTFSVAGIRTYIGIKTTKKVYKIGENINLTTYSKTSFSNSTLRNEKGDGKYIFYSFDTSSEGWTHSGTQDEWERGVPSDGDLNTCESGNCWVTDLNADYNDNANNNIVSPVLNMDGRSNSKVNFWREIDFESGINDKIYFESYDGTAWGILYQNSIGSHDQEGAFYTYYPSEIDDVSNARFRFRMTSNGGTNEDGFAFDSFNLSFDSKVNWNKSWLDYDNVFGTDNNKTTAIKIEINISSYNSSGSDSKGSLSPDLEVQIYNGTGYSGSYTCNLDSSKTYPYICDFVIKNTPEYLEAWKNDTNRFIRIRAINLDNLDSINWKDVRREYVTPSIIENHGIAQVTSILLEQFKNSTGGVVQTMHNSSIIINASETQALETYWSFSVPGGFILGNYSAYVALTDTLGNVLQNEDDNTFINDSYIFSVQSMLINMINPLEDSIQDENFVVNVSLDITYFASGGWCIYSLNGAANVSMVQHSATSFYSNLFNISDGVKDLIVYCNDSDNFIVNSGLINFNISESPRINYISPTDTDNSYVNRSYTMINVSINDSSFDTAWLEFNSTNFTMDVCSLSSGITYFCSVNVSNLKNDLYNYRICTNDSVNNIGCSVYRDININLTLPKITIHSPINNWKYIITDFVYTNISIDISSVNLDVVWLEFNSNGTKFFMNNLTYFNWSNNYFLVTGYYNITFFGNDSVGNIFNSNVYDFIVIPDKDIEVVKNITSLNDDSYSVLINITNYGTHKDYIFHDFVDSKFNYYDLNLINSGFSVVVGVYDGDMLTWNLTLPSLSSQIISYKINSTSDYNLLRSFIIGMD